MIPWIGGKYRQAKWNWEQTIKNVVESGSIKKYVEPFGGAFWNYLRADIYKSVNNVYYNDKNRFLVNLFHCVKYKRDELLEKLKQLKPNDENTFNKFRDMIFELEDNNIDFEIGNIKIAVAYAYVQLHMFNGNKITKNVKMARNKSDNPLKPLITKLENKSKDVKCFVEKIDKVAVNNKDYKQVIKELDGEDTLFYLDPPYFDKERFYAFNDFGKEEHKKLANILNNIKGKFVLSYYYFDGIEEFYPKSKFYYFEKEFTKTSSKKREKGVEILITNFNPDDFVVANNVDYKSDEIITQENKDANSVKDLFIEILEKLKEVEEGIREIRQELNNIVDNNDNKIEKIEPANNVDYKPEVKKEAVSYRTVDNVEVFIKNSINKVVNISKLEAANNTNYISKKVAKKVVNGNVDVNNVISIKKVLKVINNIEVVGPPLLNLNRCS
jgi:DNA adenine methylase